MSQIFRVLIVLVLLLLLTDSGLPAIHGTEAGPVLGRSSEIINDTYLAPLNPDLFNGTPPDPTFPGRVDNTAGPSDNWSSPESPLQPAPPELVEYPSSLVYSTDDGTFIVNRSQSVWFSIDGTYAGFSILVDGRDLLLPGSSELIAWNATRLVVSYPLGRDGETVGSMNVTYGFSSSGNKISANFTPTTPGSYQVVWVVMTDFRVVRTMDIVDPETEFVRIGAGDLGCYYGGCLSLNDSATLSGTGNIDNAITLELVKASDNRLRFDFSDAAVDYAGSYAGANFEFAGIKRNVAMVVFASGKLAIDPKIVATGSTIKYPTQRKTFFDGEAYWSFWYNTTSGNNRIQYAYSIDAGKSWSGAMTLVTQTLYDTFDVAVFGRTVAVTYATPSPSTITLWAGKIEGLSLKWNGPLTIANVDASYTIKAGSLNAIFDARGMLRYSYVDTGNSATRVMYGIYECSRYDFYCTSGQADRKYRIDDLIGDPLQPWELAVPVSFDTPDGGSAVFFASPSSKLYVVGEWVSRNNGYSTDYCWAAVDWGNLYGSVPTPMSKYFAALPSPSWDLDGIEFFTSRVNSAMVAHYTFAAAHAGSTCSGSVVFDGLPKASGIYAAQSLTAGSDLGGSLLYLSWTNSTTTGGPQRVNFAVIEPRAPMYAVEYPPWSAAYDVQYLTVGFASSRFVPILLEASGSIYFASHLLVSDAISSSNPWSQVVGAPLLNEVGTDVNPATGLVRRADTIQAIASLRGLFAVRSIFREPSLFSTGQRPFRYYRTPAKYGYIFDPVMTLDLPWIDTVQGVPVLHLPGGQAYAIVWDYPSWAMFGNNTQGVRFEARYYSTNATYLIFFSNGGRYSFNSTGRIQLIYPDGKSVTTGSPFTFTYNGNGQLTGIEDRVQAPGAPGSHRKFSVAYVGTSQRIDYIQREDGTRVVDYSYAGAVPVGCAGGTSTDSDTITSIDVLGRSTRYTVCRYLLTKVEYPSGGRSEFTYGSESTNSIAQGTEFFSLPVLTILTLNESALNKFTRSFSFVYHAVNGDVILTETRTFNGAGVLQGRRDYRFNPGRGLVATTVFDYTAQKLWYDMETVPVGTYCPNKMSDLSGSGNCGTITGANDTAGWWGRARWFGGSSSLSAGDVLDAGKESLTISAWIMAPSGSVNRNIVSKRNGDVVTNAGYQLELVSTGALGGVFSDGTANRVLITTTSPRWDDGKFHFVAGVWDRLGELSLYVDGTKRASASIAAQRGNADTADNLYVGRQTSTSTPEYFVGAIDEVHIFARALTPNEVMSLFLSSAGGIKRGGDNNWYGLDGLGSVVQTYVGEEETPSATTEEVRDDWGNPIFRRDALGNESFASFANTNHQNEFVAPPRLKRTTSGSLYSEGFDQYYHNFTVAGGAPTMTFDEDSPRYPPSLKITAPGGGATKRVERTFGSQSGGTIVLELSFKTSGTATLGFGFASTSTEVAWMETSTGSWLRARSASQTGSDCFQAVSGQWFRVTLVVQVGVRLDAYVDGTTKTACGVTMTSSAVDRIFVRLANAASANFWLDDVRVSRGRQIAVTGLIDRQFVELLTSDRIPIGKSMASSGAVTLDFLQGSYLYAMPGILRTYFPDDTLEYEAPVRDSYGGDVFAYSASKVFGREVVQLATGYGGVANGVVDDAFPLNGVACSGNNVWSLGPAYTGWDWQTLPAASGTKAHQASPVANFAVQDRCVQSNNGQPLLNLSNGWGSLFFVQYVYFNRTWPGSQEPLQIEAWVQNQISNLPTGWYGAYWGVNVINYVTGGLYMGPSPSGRGWTKLVVKLSDLGICTQTTCANIARFGYITSNGQAFWDATSVGIPSAASVSMQGLSSSVPTFKLYNAVDHTLIDTATQSSGVATIDLYAKGFTAFPAQVEIEIRDASSGIVYHGAPITVWGGDVFRYVGASHFFDSANARKEIHNGLLGTKQFFGDCLDATLCYDMETMTSNSAISPFTAVVSLKLSDLSGHGNDGPFSARTSTDYPIFSLSAIGDAASGAATTFGVGTNTTRVVTPLKPTGSGTFSFWAKPSSTSIGQVPFGTKYADGSRYFVVDIGTGGQWRVRVNADGSESALMSGVVASTGRTDHIAVAWWQSGSVYYFRFYVNGAEVSGSPMVASDNPTTLTTSWVIGGAGVYLSGYLWNPFSGSLDQIAVYGRVLLASEVGALFRSRPPNARMSFNQLDGDGLVVQSRMPENGRYLSQAYTYGPRGLPATVTKNGNVTTYGYAALYDLAYPTEVLRADGQKTHFAYDLRNGLAIGTATPDCKQVRTTYDPGLRTTGQLNYDPSPASKLWYDMETVDIPTPGASAWRLFDLSCSGVGSTAYGLTSTNLVSGIQGNALSFDGFSSQVDAGNPTGLQLGTGTVSAWIKTTGAGSGLRVVVAKGGAYGLFLQDNVLGIYDYSASTFRSTSIAVADGQWHHVAFTFQSGISGGTVVYLDGGPRLTTTMTVQSQGSNARIGSAGATQYFTGSIDEVQIFNSVLGWKEIGSLAALRYRLNSASRTAYDDLTATSAWIGYPGASTTSFDGVSEPRVLYLDLETKKMTIGSTAYLEDLSGNGNHAKNCNVFGCSAGATEQPTTNCKLGKCYYFDALSYMVVPSTSSLNVTRGLSISAWFKVDPSTDFTILSTIVSKGPYDMWVQKTLSSWYLYGKVSGVQVNSAAINLNTWYHGVLSYNGTAVQLYVNGVASGSAGSLNGPVQTTPGSVEIGSGDECHVTCFMGYLDEIQILPRGLNATEIANLYNGYSIGSSSFDGTHIERTVTDGLGRAVRTIGMDLYGRRISTAQTPGWNDLVLFSYLTTGEFGSLEYDFLGRSTKVISPGIAAGIAGTSYTKFSDRQRRTESIDSLGRRSTSTYDLLGRLTDSAAYNPSNATYNVTKTAYNAIGLPTISDVVLPSGAKQRGTSYTYYDAIGRAAFLVMPDGPSSYRAFDNDGRLSLVVDVQGHAAWYTYDLGGRITRIREASSVSSSQFFDATYAYVPNTDLLQTATNMSGTLTIQVAYSYDPLHRPASETISLGSTSTAMQFTYDSAGKVASVVYPGPKTAKYLYDTLGRVSVATFAPGGSDQKYAEVVYDRYGRTSKIWLWQAGSNTSISDAYLYDARNRITQVRLGTASTANMQLDYSYDLASQITGLADDMGTGSGTKPVSYAYDGGGRVALAKGPWGAGEANLTQQFGDSTHLGYDAAGNILNRCEFSGASCGTWTTYSYSAWGALSGVSGGITETYANDAAGAMIQRMVGGIPTYYTWDADHRLVRICIGTGPCADNKFDYLYDGLGRRVRTIDTAIGGATNTTYFGYGGERLYYTTSANGSNTYLSWYIYLGDRLLFQYDNANVRFYESDLSGNTRIVWRYNAGYLPILRYRYKPFGEAVGITTASSDFRFRFGGGAESDASGLYHMGARYADGRISRFLSRDPVPVHDHVYARDNPVSLVDPSGLYPAEFEGRVAFSGRFVFGTSGVALREASPGYPTADQALAPDEDFAQGPKSDTLPGAAKPRTLADPSEGYSSFDAFKKDFGKRPFGDDSEWHHLVEQRALNTKAFGPRRIQNPDNIVGLETRIHHEISDYYSSIDPTVSGRLTVRQYVGSLSFEEQWDFGSVVLRRALEGSL